MKYFKKYLEGEDDNLELKKGINVVTSFDKNVIAILRDSGKEGDDRPSLLMNSRDILFKTVAQFVSNTLSE